jgi:membrane fusion protein (multidrug efflux system)
MDISEKSKIRISPVLLALAATAVLVSGCGGGDAPQSLDDKRIPVLTARVERTDLRRSRTYAGSVEGVRQATVYARIAETVVRVHVSEGQKVSAGASLVSFDESGPGSAIRQARALAEDARRNAEKFQRLFDEGAVSEQERDARQTAYDVARADYEAAQDRAVVASPIGGIVTEVYTRAGRQMMPGEPLALVASADTIRVLLDVSVYESGDLAEGQRVTIRSELDTSMVTTGWIDQISSSADADTRTLSVEILADNLGRRFMPGMFVRAEIELELRSQVVSVVRDALVYRESGMGAFVVRDSVAYYVAVVPGIESGDRVEIRNGLAEGDEVVVLGQNNIQEGTKVDPTLETTLPSASAAP